jgi:hypothetical protein
MMKQVIAKKNQHESVKSLRASVRDVRAGMPNGSRFRSKRRKAALARRKGAYAGIAFMIKKSVGETQNSAGYTGPERLRWV